MQPFFRSFIKYETQVFQSYALPNLDLKAFLRYEDGSQRLPLHTGQIAIQSAGQVKTAEILSTLMMGYVLADILALHKGDVERNPVFRPNELIKSKWPVIFFIFPQILLTLTDFFAAFSVTIDSRTYKNF